MPYGWHNGGWGVLWMIVSWGLIALVVFLLVRAVAGGPSDRSERPKDARQILEERFARGEISEEEYRDRRGVLDETKR